MSFFSKKCKIYFSFLVSEFGCSYEYKGSIYGGSFYYKNQICCVKIMEERGELYISLAVLRNGEIPEYSTEINGKLKINFVDLLTIIKFKSPDDYPHYSSILNKNWKKLDLKLEEMSKALKLYADDILKGDFSYLYKLMDQI